LVKLARSMKGIDMNSQLHSLALAGLVLLSAGGASAAVTVTFSHPENFHDMPVSPTDREQILKEMSDHFAYLGKRLPPGQDLRVEVLDLELAGQIQPNFRGQQDVRIVRGGADWPHMKVRYTLESNGKVIDSGVDEIRDMAYLGHINRYSDIDRLRYGKLMIDDWFTKKFAPRKQG
jgi:Protein of unknown function (DUF3016)